MVPLFSSWFEQLRIFTRQTGYRISKPPKPSMRKVVIYSDLSFNYINAGNSTEFHNCEPKSIAIGFILPNKIIYRNEILIKNYWFDMAMFAETELH
ncbi:hypothetical protein, partial [Vibrio harveyi]|uniref:hypothetical protein n=2 Tax=Vibrio harveyi TaxID=669 RepID=UPI001E5CFD94